MLSTPVNAGGSVYGLYNMKKNIAVFYLIVC